jgi:lincosamide nucleotidyltransferase A/C/D/E
LCDARGVPGTRSRQVAASSSAVSPERDGQAENAPNMSARDALALYELFETSGVTVWLDGGWGVDALLGEQTRPHGDLDIVIQGVDLPVMREVLERRGFHDVPRDDTRPWNFVLGHGDGREVDVHAIDFDADGNGIYGPPESGEMYPAGSLEGKGSIDGFAVRCLTPGQQVRFHSGYELGESDYQDVRALCERFRLDLPDEYSAG